MDIQLQQIITHLIGFLITLFILAKFAWHPLLNLMEERRNKIAGEFDKIEEDKAEVQKLADQYELKLKEIDNERRAKITEAVIEGKKVAEEIKVTAQENARKISEKAKLELQQDIDKAKVELKEDMVKLTMMAAEKIILEKMDDAKHRELIGRYIDNIEKA